MCLIREYLEFLPSLHGFHQRRIPKILIAEGSGVRLMRDGREMESLVHDPVGAVEHPGGFIYVFLQRSALQKDLEQLFLIHSSIV